MKVVVQVRLLPCAEQAAALVATLRACNAAADNASKTAFERAVSSRNDLQKLVYGDMRAAGLGAQAAVRTVKKVVDAYSSVHARIRIGGLVGSRKAKAESKAIRFREDAAQPFDDRMLSWRYDDKTVSIWTVMGRLKGVPFAGHPAQLATLVAHRKGESDLVFRSGKWLLIATCEVPEAEVLAPNDWIGVDRGIVNLATTSDGENFQGRRLQRYRRWHARKRAELQAKGTRSASRCLRRRARREHRHVTQVNHEIAKKMVAVAQRTGRGIALEDLSGIRDRVRPRRDQRATHSSWPFQQLGAFIAYKAKRAGVPVITVDARYTSQMCPRCSHVARNNRPNRDWFCCRQCGLAGPSDHVAGINVRDRARSVWAPVNVPEPAA
ncbi:RNA-guided endonuclease InsQ/TnpB family protein [Lentzea flaviverrucosa]|uniref:Transposase, IS605 OrfB family, central region n=1 Tax=Lentzea flaviverrucosa TaxID=200379 RepID=A0A1H9P9W4_9PSEU|nr:RNA-guided endonuclease TnpB family protein [Lentzea flaviverrucosa]RDI29925.1 IS605 OrfB family transposase [Lentzea flaviverrucosa]SER44976.1 transposase, IS605 OrfB family, central region [Lentzea flaviverrucosa]